MEALITIGIVVLVLIVLLRFVGKVIKRVIQLALFLIAALVATYFIKPTVLEDFFGKENVDWVVGEVEEKVDDVSEMAKQKADSLRKEATND